MAYLRGREIRVVRADEGSYARHERSGVTGTRADELSGTRRSDADHVSTRSGQRDEMPDLRESAALVVLPDGSHGEDSRARGRIADRIAKLRVVSRSGHDKDVVLLRVDDRLRQRRSQGPGHHGHVHN